jgi:hypothetical protein
MILETCISGSFAQVYRLQPWEEALGLLKNVQLLEGYALAEIGPVTVALPIDLGERLSYLIGQRIGVIRTENDYRMRIISTSKSNLQSAKAQNPLLEKIPAVTDKC